MALAEAYRRQVALLLKTIPFIAKETCFALRGGTAINLFVRHLPRLSVDIDLRPICRCRHAPGRSAPSTRP